ncbi:MAG: DUF4388 domain-containing protein [Nitriliruptoraceae bacterium]
MRGDLAETTPAALLAALGRGRARGRLQLDGPEGRGEIVFWDGQVVDASSPAPRAQLVERLARTGRLPKQHGTVDAAVADRLRAEPVVDAVAELLSWRSGRYVLAPAPEDASEPDLDGPRLPVTVILEQAQRRRARLDQLAWLLPSLEVVPRPASEPPLHLDLGTDAAALLEAADGLHDATALAHHLGLGGLEVLRLLAALHALGQVDITVPGAAPEALAPTTADIGDTVAGTSVSRPTPEDGRDAGDDAGHGRVNGQNDATDVAAFLRELSSLALGEDRAAPSTSPRRQPPDDAAPADGGAGTDHGTPASGRQRAGRSHREPEPSRREPGPSRRRRGLFGRS